MYKHTLSLILLLFGSISFSYSQTDDDNIIITNRSEEYSFEIDKSAVAVKEKTITEYERTKAYTSIPVAEMYDNQSSIDKVNIKGAKGVYPKYNMYRSGEIFYSDAKICHFELPFEKMGEPVQVKFEKTYKDSRYFTSVYLSEPLFTKKKTVTITVPEWMNVELIERNFGKNITKEIKEGNKERTYIYQIENQEAMKDEPYMQGRSHIYPHIQVLTKSAMIKGEKVVYFEKLENQYAWYRDIVSQVNDDKAIIAAKAKEITARSKTDEEKIKALFGWVQSNIRYVAFEDGIAGFKPDDAQEVLRKKYGDCKGMSNLLKALLEAEGFDARLTWIGTNHIAYDYGTPSLAVDNHMICTLFFGSKTYYLDPTVEYMPLGEYPQTIQGRQAMIQDKDKFILTKVPVFSPEQNTDSLYCEYTIDNDKMIGKAAQSYHGESKQLILSLMDATPKDKREDALKNFLEKEVVQDKAKDIQLTGADPQSKSVNISYSIENKSGIQSVDNEYYIGLDHYKDFMTHSIDTKKRVNDFLFRYKHHIVQHVVLNIPDGYKVSHVPDDLDVKTDGYTFKVGFTQSGNQVIYKKEITIANPLLRKAQFEDWNATIEKLKKNYMEQIVLTKK